MSRYLSCYALVICLLAYMAGIVTLHALGIFPKAGLHDLSQLQGTPVLSIEGEVLDAPVVRWGQTRFLMRARARPLEGFTGKVMVTLPFPDQVLAPGDHVRARGWLSPTPERSRSYWASRRVYSFFKVWSEESFTLLTCSSAWSLKRAAWSFQNKYREFWEARLPWNECALLLGVTVGARGILPHDIKEACIRAGVYHIVVVSGQNMSLIVNVGILVLLMFAVPRRHALWICMPLILFYSAAVGSDPPVMRAAATAIVGLVVWMLGRDVPHYYPLCISAGWILLREPEALLGASFQLSFAATLSILLLLPYWEEWRIGLKSWWRWFAQALWLGCAVHIGIWPILVAYFGRLSMAGLFANWTVFPLSGVLMVYGLLVGTWGAFAPTSVPDLLLIPLRGVIQAMLFLIEHMAQWPWAMREIKPLSSWTIALYYGGLFGILLLVHRRKIKQTHEKSRPRLQRR